MNKTSLIYKYLDEGLLEAPIFVPNNSCPYISWFVWNITREFIGGFAFIFIVQNMLWSPIYFILGMKIGDKLEYIEVCAFVGLVTWGVSLFMAIIWLIVEIIEKIRQVKITANIFYKWYKIIHDKVCK